jgi:hypothetical protein
MAGYLPASGNSLSMSQINSVFDGRGNNLNAYRGTTWYTAAGGSGTFSSGTISFNDFYLKGPSPNVTISLAQLQGTGFYEYTAGSGYVTLTFNNNGTWNANGSVSGNLGSGNWASPTTTSIGNSYWIRWTRTSSSLGGGSSTPSSGWNSLSGTNTIQVTHNGISGGVVEATYTLEISTNSGGTNIVASSTGTLLYVFNEG